MAVALLLVTHGEIGEALLLTAERILGRRPLRTACIGVDRQADPTRVKASIDAAIAAHDDGDGVLVLTDLYGATPCNLARQSVTGQHGIVVAGINLSMLVKLFNYPELELARLAAKAVEGGRQGVIQVVDQEV